MRRKKKKQNKKLYPYVLLFILGILIFIYPFISQIYYNVESNNKIESFTEEAKKIGRQEIDKKIELARAYNNTLDPTKLADPYTDNEKKGIAEYARMLEVKEMMGHVEIPKIDVNLPIYAGTFSDVLDKGAGHLEGTSLPVGGDSTHTVITAHRGLSSAVMFRQLDKLEKGDIFLIHNISEVLAYEVDNIQIVEPSNFEPVLVVKDKDYATLLTCDPYVINSHRLLVRGHRVPYVKDNIVHNNNSNWWKYVVIAVAILLALIILYYRRKKKNDKKK